MVCGYFILPEPASYVFFYAIFNLRNLFYLIFMRFSICATYFTLSEHRQLIEKRQRHRANGSLTSNLYRLTAAKKSQPPAKGRL